MMSKTMTAVVGVCAAAMLAGGTARGQVVHSTCEIESIVGDTTTAGDSFGAACAMSGDVIVVGSPGADSAAGSAFVFRRFGAFWQQEATLVADVPTAGDEFGTSVAIDGDYAVVGAPFADGIDTATGAAFVYHYDGSAWTFQAKLTSDDGATDDFFGHAVSININSHSDIDRILVGAYGDDDDGPSSGSAYIFQRSESTWTQQIKLAPGFPDDSAQFGWSVAINRAYAMIGADQDGGTGAVYLYHSEGGTWMPWQTIRGEHAGDAFGHSISASLGTMTVGAPYGDGNVVDSGTAYVYSAHMSSWQFEGKLFANDGAANDRFGWSVSDLTFFSLVGTKPDMGVQPSDVYLYTMQVGVMTQTDEFTASEVAAGDQFGVSIGMSDGRAVVGAPLDDAAGADAGAAYTFVLYGDDCNGNGEPDECDIASGTSQDCNGNNIPDDCETDCNGNGVPDDCDIASGTSLDCNGNGVPDDCETDCNGNGVPDDCDIANGTSQDCDADGVPDECEPDCNGNGIPDDCDLLNGTSEDCNGNGVPDECDIASGFSMDANHDGIPDSCTSCPCDLTGDSTVDVFDLLMYLSQWFAMDPAAELDGSDGITVSDLLDYLSCWFPATSRNCL